VQSSGFGGNGLGCRVKGPPLHSISQNGPSSGGSRKRSIFFRSSTFEIQGGEFKVEGSGPRTMGAEFWVGGFRNSGFRVRV
jgi:hypothetical protein